MVGTGNVFQRAPSLLGTVAFTESGGFTWCRVTMGSAEVIKIPLALDINPDEAIVRLSNIINQTGLVDYPAEVVLD